MTVDEKLIRAALAQLPRDPGEIAAFLLREGVRGVHASACSCPLANWLSQKTGRPLHIASNCVLGETRPHFLGTLAFLPDACARFVTAFDGGAYPELVAA